MFPGVINGMYKNLSSFAQSLLQTVFSMTALGFKGGAGFMVTGAALTGTMVAGEYMGHFKGMSSSGAFDIVYGVPAPEAGTGIYFVVAAIVGLVVLQLKRLVTRV